MKKDERLAALSTIESAEPIMTKYIWYNESSTKFGVHEIPLDLLTYNPYNGRIMSLTISFEKQHADVDLTKDENKELIEKFLWDSAPDYNQNTLKSLRQYGQNEIGIVTKDGVIIDGNRRAYLLSVLNKEDGLDRKFLAIILPDELENKRDEISKLETIYQIGVDDKVDYNPIEKYLKSDELKKFFDVDKIAELMSEKPSKINSYLAILNLMKEYLDYLGYPEVFTKLYKKEGHFVDLNNYLNSYSKSSTKYQLVNWQYNDNDISELKKIYFDYIRLGLPVSNTRVIGRPNNANSFFCHQDVWSGFKLKHQETLASYKEPTLKEFQDINKGTDLENTTIERDISWGEKVGSKIVSNLTNYIRILEDKKNSDSPIDLLTRAKGTLSLIDVKHIDIMNKDEVQIYISELKQLLSNFELHIISL